MTKDQTAEERQKQHENNIKSLILGESWFAISKSWYDKWSQHIGADSSNLSAPSPGPIDNRSILDSDGSVKETSMLELDFTFIHKDLWDFLYSKYGVKSDKDIIERFVINDSVVGQALKIEIRLIKVKVTTLNLAKNEKKTILISRQEKLDSILKKIRNELNIPEQKQVKFFWKPVNEPSKLIEEPENNTLSSIGYSDQDTLIVNVQADDGSFAPTDETSLRGLNGSLSRPSSSTVSVPSVDSLNKYTSSFTSGGSISTKTGTGMVTRSKNTNDTSFSSRYSDSRAGLCGLNNLGNTCFMNSSLQCMSNVPMLTEYFKSGEYKKEINYENPLGRKGEFAMAYAELVQEMWSGSNSYTTPRQFKMHLSKFAPQFTGFQQQDSQELLAYMLDGLHEDLNRILKKPYIEVDETNKPDEALAKETWDCYRKRNDSIIVDIFHGLIKSTLNCLECNNISIKFDPICYLSLPLPSKKERLIKITFVPLSNQTSLTKFKLNVLKGGSINDLYVALEQYTQISKQKMIACDVYSNKFFHVYESSEPVANIRENDDIFIYELPTNLNNQDYIKMKVLLKYKSNYQYSSYFGLPLYLSVPKNELTASFLREKVFSSLKRFLVNVDDQTNSTDNTSQGSEDTKINSKLNNLDFSDNSNDYDENKDETKTKQNIFKLFISTSDNDDKNHLVDDQLNINLNESSPNQLYTLVVEFTSKAKDHNYNPKTYESNAETHESCYSSLENKKDHLVLDDCFNLFTKKEELSDLDLWFCPKCKQHQHATKQIDLWSLAPVLVIHLKRFSYSRVFRDKIDTLVDFPITDLDLSKYIYKYNKNYPDSTKYNLIAISNHYGSLGGGHYTAYAQNRQDGQWYNFDDSSVTSTDETNLCTTAAYLLVYLRKDLHQQYIKRDSSIINNNSRKHTNSDGNNENEMDLN